jgi:hypothetical protein
MPKTEGRLPDFIIVGATKAGTTSLDFYLSLHPEIHMARPKEPRFFIEAEEPFGRWSRGLDWYRSLYNSNKAVCGETSPTYATWPYREGVMEKMAMVVPEAKIVFLVREHFSRLRSSYLMNVRYRGLESSFQDFVQSSPWAVASSLYGMQIQNILRFYPLDRVCIMESDSLENRREWTLEKMFGFLGVDTKFSSPLFRHRRHDSRWHIYPNAIGRKILRSRASRKFEEKLPSAFFYHFRNALNLLFADKKPRLDLDAELEKKISEDFQKDTLELRKLTGLPLRSLGG